MSYGPVVVPFMSAFIGWFTNRIAVKMLFYPREPKKIAGFTLQGVFPKKQKQLAERLGKLVSAELFSFGDIEQKLTDPGNMQRLLPVIEEHIDHFLRVKLPQQMPMIGMFIGDRTIGEMKKVFMDELEILFPVILKNYMSGLQKEFDPEKLIIEKFGSFSAGRLEQVIKTGLRKELRLMGILGAVAGFIIGLLQVLIMIS